MAEVYHIYDLKALQPLTVARLVLGLRDNSRVKMAYSGLSYTFQDIILAQCADALSLLWWSKTVDGQNNRNRPQSIMAILTGKESKNKPSGFNTPEEFEEKLKELKSRK